MKLSKSWAVAALSGALSTVTYAAAHEVKAFTRRVVAIGDLHSDFDNALTALRLGKLVDANGDWIAGDTIFVQTGDIIDRWTDTIKLFRWMDQLRDQARAAGGQVISHLGNHEWMESIGDWRYATDEEKATFGNDTFRFEVLDHDWIGQTWRKNYSITTRLPLHPSLGPVDTDFHPGWKKSSNLTTSALSFVHGGLSPTYSNLTPYPSRINEIGASLLAKLQARSPLPQPFPPAEASPGLPATATPEEVELYSPDGPLWYRGWALDGWDENGEDDSTICPDVDNVLAQIGSRRMIMGHTPLFTEITTRCEGKVVIIDTGISRGVLDSPSALEILYTLNPTAHSLTWEETEVLTAFYPTGNTTLWTETCTVVGDFAKWHV
ncbi:Metallo-dependent phosphatase [Exidia glandulosa HHB12029]|uniref:Metallo-dependent phosphatase n=1 Tax=Exidia glandulosa HHB12029 TaxID=1314781 RepID=A0A165FF37_EXIGL|nr:Metallo-dependent phosphatase [Exidia glandulosa HHB12029]